MYGNRIIEKEFKVGDIIKVNPRFGRPYSLVVTRLTKLHAVCEWTRQSDGMKLVQKFKRNYRINGNWFSVTPVPMPDWQTDTYEVTEA